MEGSNQCSNSGCSASASDFCIFCKKNYCREHIFNHDCNQNEDDINNSDENSNENIQDNNENKCATPGCNDEATDFCIFCKKNYCEDHIFNHECNRTDQSAKKNANNDADGNENENDEEYVDTKCDFLCCTLEAPFSCPICQQRFCEKHALNHECIQTGPHEQPKKSEQLEPPVKNKDISNNSVFVNKDESKQENTEEYIDDECDYLGCTGEAPFFCSICQQHYCAKHALRHDCKL